MSTVTIRPGATPSEQRSLLEQELRIEKPHLTEAHARRLITEAHPELCELDHLGLNEAPVPTVDPAEVINRRAHQLLESRQAVNRAEAVEMAMRQLPAAAAAYDACEWLPAGMVEEPVTGPARQHSDPSDELMRLTAATMAAEGLSVDEARRAVLKRDPLLARHYSEATPLPMGLPARPAGRIDDLVADGLARFARLQQELGTEIGVDEGRRHYSQLSAAEKEHYLPSARKLRPGERPHIGEVRVEKMASDAVGGGSFAVRERVA